MSYLFMWNYLHNHKYREYARRKALRILEWKSAHQLATVKNS